MNKITINLDKLYSTTEVAQIMRVSSVTVFKRIKKGQLPAEKIGRNYAVKGEDLNEYINPSDKLNDKKKKIIEGVVERVVNEYGEALRKLGKE